MSFTYLRKFALIVAVALLIGVLSACGQAADGEPQSSPSSAVSEPVSAADGNKVGEDDSITYQAANGDIKIPVNPDRVVVLADSFVGYLLALDITPVGVNQHALSNPYFKGMLDDVQNLGDGKSVETILELQPDLIITFSGDEAAIEQLAKIAPTAAIDYGKLAVREQLLEFGAMTGREEKAKEWIAEWDAEIAEYGPQINASVGEQTVSILQPYAKGIYAFGHNYGRGGEILYGEFQLKAPDAIQAQAIDSGTGWANLSLETLPEFAGDYIFTSPWSGDDGSPDDVYDSNLWRNLPAVQNNRVFTLNRAGSYFNDPVSLEAHLKFIVESLIE